MEAGTKCQLLVPKMAAINAPAHLGWWKWEIGDGSWSRGNGNEVNASVPAQVLPQMLFRQDEALRNTLCHVSILREEMAGVAGVGWAGIGPSSTSLPGIIFALSVGVPDGQVIMNTLRTPNTPAHSISQAHMLLFKQLMMRLKLNASRKASSTTLLLTLQFL